MSDSGNGGEQLSARLAALAKRAARETGQAHGSAQDFANSSWVTPATALALSEALSAGTDYEFDSFLRQVEEHGEPPPWAEVLLRDLAMRMPLERLEALQRVHQYLNRRLTVVYEQLQEALYASCVASRTTMDLARLAQLNAAGLRRLRRALGPAEALFGALEAEVIRVLRERPHNFSLQNAAKGIGERANVDGEHFLFELVQNADDAGAGQWIVTYLPDSIVVEHDGLPVSGMDVVGLCSLGASRKNATSIGTFGMGFRSVLMVTQAPRFECEFFNFEIGPTLNPRPISARPYQGRTRLTLPLKAQAPALLREDRAAGGTRIDDRFLLTLRNLKRLTVVSGGGREEWTVENQRGSLVRSRHNEKESQYYLERWSSADGLVTVGFAADAASRLEPAEHGLPTLYAGLPTREQTGLRFWVDAPFEPTLSRDAILDSERNRNLLHSVPNAVRTLLQKIPVDAIRRGEALSVLPTSAELRGGPFAGWLLHVLRNHLAPLELVPTPDGNRRPDATFVSSEQLIELLGAEMPRSFAGGRGDRAGTLAAVSNHLADRERELAIELGAVRIDVDAVLNGLAALDGARGLALGAPALPSGLRSVAGLARLHAFLLGLPASARVRAKLAPIFLARDGRLRPVYDNRGFPQLHLLEDWLERAGGEALFSPKRVLLHADARTELARGLAGSLGARQLGLNELVEDLRARGSLSLVEHEVLGRIWEAAAPGRRAELGFLTDAPIWPTATGELKSARKAGLLRAEEAMVTRFLNPTHRVLDDIDRLPHVRALVPALTPSVLVAELIAVVSVKVERTPEALFQALSYLAEHASEVTDAEREQLQSARLFADTAGQLRTLPDFDDAGDGEPLPVLWSGLEPVLRKLALIDPQVSALRTAERILQKGYLRCTNPEASLALFERVVGLLADATASQVRRLLHGDIPLLARSGRFVKKRDVRLLDGELLAELARFDALHVRALSEAYSAAAVELLRAAEVETTLGADELELLFKGHAFDAEKSAALRRIVSQYCKSKSLPAAVARAARGTPWLPAQSGELRAPNQLFAHMEAITVLLGDQPSKLVSAEVYAELHPALREMMRWLQDVTWSDVALGLESTARAGGRVDMRVFEWLEAKLESGSVSRSDLKSLMELPILVTSGGSMTPRATLAFLAPEYFGPYRAYWPEGSRYPRLCAALGTATTMTEELVNEFLRQVDGREIGPFDEQHVPAELARCLRACLNWLAEHDLSVSATARIIPCARGDRPDELELRAADDGIFLADHPGHAHRLSSPELIFWLVDPPWAAMPKLAPLFENLGILSLAASVEVKRSEGERVDKKLAAKKELFEARLRGTESELDTRRRRSRDR